MSASTSTLNWLLGVAGGIIGGGIGYFAFFFLTRQGLYAMVLPGALLGLGCGYLSGFKSTTLGILCGLVAVLLAIFIEWQFAPFVRDNSFTYFILHFYKLKPMTLVMIVIGGLFGFWFGKGREGGVGFRRNKTVSGD